MKKVGKLFLGLIIGATVLLSSCSSGGSNSIPLLPSGGNSDIEVAPGTVDILPAPLLKSAELAKSIDASNNDVILFYYREDGNYSDWGLWL